MLFKKNDYLEGLFSKKDVPYMNKTEFDEAVRNLIAKGLLDSREEDGEIKYYLTPLGYQFGKHMDTDPSTRN
jgi:hypothetical protein